MSELAITGTHEVPSASQSERAATWLKFGFALELLLGIFFVVPMLTSEHGSLGYLLFWGPCLLLNGAIMLASLWAMAKRRDLRALALRNLVTPLALLVAPIIVRQLAGGALFPTLEAGGMAPVYVAAAALLVGLLAFPHPIAMLLPSALWRSRRLHRWVAIGLAVLIALNVLLWVLSVAGFVLGEAKTVDKDLGWATLLAAGLIGLGSLGLGAFTLLWSYLALRQHIDRNYLRLRVIALAESLLLCALGAGGAALCAGVIGAMAVHHS